MYSCLRHGFCKQLLRDVRSYRRRFLAIHILGIPQYTRVCINLSRVISMCPVVYTYSIILYYK